MLAAIYLRLSRNEEHLDIDEILSNHKRALIKLAEQNNLVYDIYQEISSGVNTEREQLNLLLSRIEDYDYLLVTDIDRISRDNAYAEQIKTILIANDIVILTPQGSIDLSQETNEMLFSFQAMIANLEYKQIKKRLSRGRLAAAEKGFWTMSNKAPLGYKKNDEKRLEINEDEAKIIRFIFDKTLERMSSNEIAKELYGLGWKSRQGKIITTSHIASFRRNPVYYGAVHACRRNNGRVVDEVHIENAHEPIIPKQKWLEVQEIINENKDKKFYNKVAATRALQNLIYCNCCGRKRYIQRDTNGKDYIKSCTYKISNNMCQDKGFKYEGIEQAVFKNVKEYKNKLKEALKRLKSLDTSEVENKLATEKQSLEKQLEKFEKRKLNLQEMRMDGEITKQEFYNLRDDNEEKINQINDKIDRANIQLENISNTEEEQEKLQYIISMIDNLEELNPEQCNTFLKTFILKIHFSSNNITDYNTKRQISTPTVEIEYRR